MFTLLVYVIGYCLGHIDKMRPYFEITLIIESGIHFYMYKTLSSILISHKNKYPPARYEEEMNIKEGFRLFSILPAPILLISLVVRYLS